MTCNAAVECRCRDAVVMAVLRALASEEATHRLTFLQPLYSDGTVGAVVPVPARAPEVAVFCPTDFQLSILRQLEGKALMVRPLADACGCGQGRLYQKPGGLPEMVSQGFVNHTEGLGFWRPDAPPPGSLALSADAG